ncbi:helix-turn-helix domain-containing protein [Paenibacillus filicis]|uniref:Helix-turn-helix domain-containing protein n=1 Tax=Paenibacillus gyeongsangnamensis TaxID=3388067 RepID=A0ABT4QAW5_9BACL|nr:helix-turn-helix domain-containing protein [Paenibacillus filicis]MCZ8513980.1 helix-turn-helix domain-containing protein [Paenibacillus filicis]
MNSHVPMPSMGVLYLSEGSQKFQLTRHAPSEDLRFFVKHYWIVTWDLTGQPPYLQDVFPNPCVNLVIEPGKSGIFGPAKAKFSYLLQGQGCVFGVKFKPGGFYPFLRRQVTGLSEHPIPIRDVFDVDAAQAERDILSRKEERQMVELAEGFLRPKLPGKDETITLINDIIDRIRDETDITRVDHIAECFGLSVRKLQRLFHQYVGVSPKWVIQLYRLHNAAEAAERGRQPDWLKLSMDLGYHDQSHFIKDFKAATGKTPEEYARRNA